MACAAACSIAESGIPYKAHIGGRGNKLLTGAEAVAAVRWPRHAMETRSGEEKKAAPRRSDP